MPMHLLETVVRIGFLDAKKPYSPSLAAGFGRMLAVSGRAGDWREARDDGGARGTAWSRARAWEAHGYVSCTVSCVQHLRIIGKVDEAMAEAHKAKNTPRLRVGNTIYLLTIIL